MSVQTRHITGLAGLLIALRAGGAALGWGFQLQEPWVVITLLYLLLALGLNLSGVFNIGGGLAGVGQALTEHKGLRGTFATGVLAVIVASPCTAPFMGTALGFALTRPPLETLLVFAALGVGLALPVTAALLLTIARWATSRRASGSPCPSFRRPALTRWSCAPELWVVLSAGIGCAA